MTRPIAWPRLLGYSRISTFTTSPGFAPCVSPRAIKHLGPRLAAFEHEIDAALAAKVPDDARLAARENLDDVPFVATACLAGARGDAVAIPQQLHFAGGEIEIAAAVVGSQETEAVAVRKHRARHDVEMARQTEFVGTITQQLTVSNHRAHARFERATVLLRVDSETRRESFELQRLARLLHRRENFLTSRDLVLIAPFVGAGVLRAARHQEKPRGASER